MTQADLDVFVTCLTQHNTSQTQGAFLVKILVLGYICIPPPFWHCWYILKLLVKPCLPAAMLTQTKPILRQKMFTAHLWFSKVTNVLHSFFLNLSAVVLSTFGNYPIACNQYGCGHTGVLFWNFGSCMLDFAVKAYWTLLLASNYAF